MKKQMKFPGVDWANIAAHLAFANVAMLLVALITRTRSLLIVIQFLDVAFVLALLGMLVFALVKRYQK